MNRLELTGLDGKNPLGFLAALGALGAVADASAGEAPAPGLGWRTGASCVPFLTSPLTRASLLDVLYADLMSFRDEPALKLEYPKGASGGVAQDLKPPPEEYRRFLIGLVEGGSARSLAYGACLATDVAVDNNGNAKPTALHFTAGQQEFLAMVRELVDGVTSLDFEEAVFGPWRNARPLPVLGWDSSSSRDYALRASDPSKDKKLGVPAADWLAFRGLAFLRVAPHGTEIRTTGCHGGWKTGAFRWPLWTASLPRSVIASLLTSPELREVDARTLGARGVDLVLESSIRRSDQGGYGSFGPSHVAKPLKV